MKKVAWIASFIFMTFMYHAVFSQKGDVIKIDSAKVGQNDAIGKYAPIRGFKMYYESYGKGEPMLMIHGNGGNISNMLYQIPYFAQHYHVIVADSRDQGKSGDPIDSISYEMMADDLNALLEYLSIDSAYVIGWSDGGINGLLLAMRHPDKVKKLAVTGANLWPDSTAVDSWIIRDVEVAYKALQNDKSIADRKHILKLLHLLLFEPHISTSDLAKIHCPTLVIGGDHDVILPQHTMLIAQSIPKSYLWILPNSGHSTPIVYHDQFNKAIGDFFLKPYRKIEQRDRFN